MSTSAASGNAARSADRTTYATGAMAARATRCVTTSAARTRVAVVVVTATVREEDKRHRCDRDHHQRTGEFFEHVRILSS
jgi:hypothetical protein